LNDPPLNEDCEDEINVEERPLPGLDVNNDFQSRKRKLGKRESKMTNPAFLPKLLSHPCCSKRCLEHVDLDRVYFDRKEYHGKNEQEKSDWIYWYKKHAATVGGKIVFKIAGKVCEFFFLCIYNQQLTCRKAFLLYWGISSDKFKNTSKRIKEQSYKAEKRENVGAWLDSYVDKV